jgi:histidinol-phosphate phosphatase family protein
MSAVSKDFEWVEGAAETIAAFNRRGWFVFVVTNQSGIARNYYTEADMHALHEWMQAELAKAGANIDRIYYCPYHEAGENPAYRKDSFDRKPKPGMLLHAMSDFPGKAGTELHDRRQGSRHAGRPRRRGRRFPFQRRQPRAIRRMDPCQLRRRQPGVTQKQLRVEIHPCYEAGDDLSVL